MWKKHDLLNFFFFFKCAKTMFNCKRSDRGCMDIKTKLELFWWKCTYAFVLYFTSLICIGGKLIKCKMQQSRAHIQGIYSEQTHYNERYSTLLPTLLFNSSITQSRGRISAAVSLHPWVMLGLAAEARLSIKATRNSNAEGKGQSFKHINWKMVSEWPDKKDKNRLSMPSNLRYL